MNNRPKIGCIVEGEGERYSYPSLISKILKQSHHHVPIVPAGGCGGITRNLEEKLESLFRTHKPESVIVTIDLQDLLKQNLYPTCIDAVRDLDARGIKWIEANKNQVRFHPLPDRIITVVQDKKYESWLISDLESLRDSGLLIETFVGHTDADSVPNPCSWINKNFKMRFNSKSPAEVKRLVSNLDADKMRQCSRSFDKFFREVHICVGSEPSR